MNIKNSKHRYRNALALLLMLASACGGAASKSSVHAGHQDAAEDATSDLPLCPVGCAPIITGPSEGSFHPVSPGGDIGTEPITPPPAAAEPTPAPPAHEGSGGSGLTPLPPLPTLPAPEPAPADTGSSPAPKAAPAPASLPNFTPNFPPVPQTPDFKLPNQPDPSTTGAGNSSTGATLASLYAAYFGAQVAKLDADVVAANASAATTLASGRESRAKHQPRAAGKISAGEHPVSSSLSPEDAALLTEAWMYRDKVAAAIEPTDPRAQDRLDLVKAADSGLSQADDAFTKGKRAIGEFSYRFSIMALDMAISVSPAGWAKFGMEAITGRDMLTNAPLSDFSRGVAIAVTATTVAGLVLTSEMSIPAIVAIDTIGVALKTLSKQARWSEALVEAEKIVNSAKKWDSVESLLHVAKGNYQIAADGTRQLVSGMHTNFGFDNFLKLNQTAGKTFSIRNVTVFTAERIEAGGEILSQTLVNGVKRIQIPRDAWVNARAYDSAVAYTEGGQRLKGVKSLWPESYDIQKIGDITTRLVEANPSVRNDLIEATVDGIKINVRVDAAGKVITSYPAWKQ